MVSKDHIVSEIKRIAGKIGRPPGRGIFEKESGIRMPEWYGVHWRSWGEALKEAGFEPNTRQQKFSPDELLHKYAEAVRHFERIPAEIDIRMYSREHEDFPGHSTFANHFGNKAELVATFSNWVRKNDEFGDLIDLLPEPDDQESVEERGKEGLVYLLRSGKFFKIGRSDDLERRIKQISVALPDEVTLEHAIRTDDPPGIEAYWHRRFADRRRNGEWFSLSATDVRAFKRRRFQ